MVHLAGCGVDFREDRFPRTGRHLRLGGIRSSTHPGDPPVIGCPQWGRATRKVIDCGRLSNLDGWAGSEVFDVGCREHEFDSGRGEAGGGSFWSDLVSPSESDPVACDERPLWPGGTRWVDGEWEFVEKRSHRASDRESNRLIVGISNGFDPCLIWVVFRIQAVFRDAVSGQRNLAIGRVKNAPARGLFIGVRCEGHRSYVKRNCELSVFHVDHGVDVTARI